MRIVFVVKTLAVAGGAERVLRDIAGELARRDHEVTVLILEDHERSFYDFDPAVRLVGLSGSKASALVRVRPYLRRLAPDVAVGFMHSAYLPLGLALAGSGIPVVASEHTTYDHYRTRPLQRLLLGATPWLTAAATIPSTAAKATFPTRLAHAMSIVPNPISPPSDRRAETNPAGLRKTLLSVGSLTPIKNHAALIRSFAAIADKLPEWTLRIVGDGPLRDELQAQIDAARLASRVVLVGPVVRIWDEYLAAQAFVSTSNYESDGLSLAEALSVGLPVIVSSRCAGFSELIIHDRNGLIADPADDAAFTARLHSLLRDHALRLRLSNGEKVAISRRSPREVGDIWEGLLEFVAVARDR